MSFRCPPRRTPPPYEDPAHDEVDGWPGAAVPGVVEVENPVIATLLGPDGEALIEIHERPVVPFGFQSRRAT